jgi:hypothetical protein
MSENHRPSNPALEIADDNKFKIAQALYNVVTGKTERLTNFYDRNFKIGEAALTQLHAKLTQMRGQWNVLQSNDSITLHHTSENKEQFSSFERFRIYDKSRPEPVETIVYQHNFLIALPGTDSPQSYTATVRMHSRAALHENIQRALPPAAILKFFQKGTIIVEIDYVDYTVARNISSTIDSWVNEIETTSEASFVLWIQRYSHWIPRIFFLLIFSIAFFAITRIAGSLDVSASPLEVGRMIVFCLPFLWFVAHLAKALGHLVEQQVDQFLPLSFIDLNVGDRRVAQQADKKNRSFCCTALIWGLAVAVEGIGIGLLTSWLYERLR